ncbi:MAG: DUF1285 domain-containing protein [Bradyrhizobiaceae bacterium]|nr:DUF1285 domain-containing protein [Bradyrhizobiaceae bacterium]
MSKARQSTTNGLEVFADTVKTASGKGPAPVHLWNPPFCGEIDMRIAADGTWYYHGTPIGRPALVKLFASILKREGDSYFLVTPAEKCGIVVADAPFTAVELEAGTGAAGQELRLRTNVDDWVTCGPGHDLRFESESASCGLKPYVHVRSNLWARATRAVWFELVELGEVRDVGGTAMFGVASAGAFYAMAPAGSLQDIAR